MPLLDEYPQKTLSPLRFLTLVGLETGLLGGKLRVLHVQNI